MTVRISSNSKHLFSPFTLAALTTVVLSSGSAQAANGKVAILQTSVVNTPSIEEQSVSALGFTPELIDDLTWGSMTQADFADYEAIVIGDPDCEGSVDPSVTAAIANATVWAPAADGNVLIAGTDPTYHALRGHQGAQELIDNAIAFALADSGTGITGAYISLSCYHTATSGGTAVPLLDGFGDFALSPTFGGLNDIRLLASHPALAGLDEADLRDWNSSVHESFQVWPSQFEELAIAADPAGNITANDGTVGFPYILARGIILPECGNGVLDSLEECDDGNNVDGDGCDAACNLECQSDSDGDGVCDEIDVCPGGDDTTDSDGDGIPDFCDPCPQDPNQDDPNECNCDVVADDYAPWALGVTHALGDRVSYDGGVWECRQAHTVHVANWTPVLTPALWWRVADCSNELPEWTVQVLYAVGDHVVHNGIEYTCFIGHTALPGWNPNLTPALWQPV